MVDLFRRIPVILLTALVGCASLLVSPDQAVARSSFVVLTSRHKHPPRQAGSIQSATGSRTAVVLCEPSRPAKSLPGAQKSVKGPSLSASALRKKLSSRSAIVVDALTGRALYAHASDLPGQPASTIKVLTGLIAINALKNDDWVPVSRRAANMPCSKVYLSKGKSYRANDLINAVLIASANDASVALAEKIAGSERAFAKRMTNEAGKLGARHTVCKTASGLTAKGQQSTVQDLALLFGEAMKSSEFAGRIARTRVKTSYGKVLRNHNKALWQVRGTEGGKTGYTRAARQTYVGKFRRPEGELLVAVMGSETMWDDIARLVEYGFRAQKHEQANLVLNPSVDVRLASVRRDLEGRYGGLTVLTNLAKSPKM